MLLHLCCLFLTVFSVIVKLRQFYVMMYLFLLLIRYFLYQIYIILQQLYKFSPAKSNPSVIEYFALSNTLTVISHFFIIFYWNWWRSIMWRFSFVNKLWLQSFMITICWMWFLVTFYILIFKLCDQRYFVKKHLLFQ